MRFTFLCLCVCAVSLATRSWAVDDKAPPKKPVPFWQLPAVKLDLSALKPATVSLLSAPDRTDQFALLQSQAEDPTDKFIPSNPSLVRFVEENKASHVVAAEGLRQSARPYVDRKYKIQQMDAALEGLTLLQTMAGQKAIVDARYSIVLETAKPCHVFVAIDERALNNYAQHGVPTWLEEYSPTGLKIATDDPLMGQLNVGFLVFVRTVPAGRIALGSPGMDTLHNSMYFAFFAEAR